MRSSKPSQKTIVLLPPEELFVNQFLRKSKFKKIVWKRKHKYDNVIALEEWDQYLALRIIYGIPVILFAFVTFLLFLIFVGPYYFINKIKANKLFDKYMKMLNFFLKERKNDFWTTTQKLANEIICNQSDKEQYYILYLHETEKELLKEIDTSVVSKYIDQIWIYNHTAELFERIIKEGYTNPLGKIVDFEVISTHSIWSHKDRNSLLVQNDFNWVGKMDLHKLLFNASSIPSITGKTYKPRIPSPRIILQPNDILNNEVVFYYESSYNENVNKYISENYLSINEKLANKGMRLLYFPKNQIGINKQASQEVLDYVKYKFPQLFNGSKEANDALLTEIFSQTQSEHFYSDIAAVLGIPDNINSCFIHCVDMETEMNHERKYQYSYHQFTDFDIATIEKEINHYIHLVAIPREQVFFSLAAPDPNDPDETFYSEGSQINDDLKNAIKKLTRINDEKLIIDTLVFLIKKLNKTQPQLCAHLNETLFKKITNQTNELSRIQIDEHYRIILLDYDNLEIQMTPLQKTLYFFFLKNEDGVKLKELSAHRAELIEIYGKVGNRLDLDQVKKSINDLTDATSNSVNEKCSKIKEAFLSKIDDAVAKHYYITGYRSQNKKIILDRSLVTFSQTK